MLEWKDIGSLGRTSRETRRECHAPCQCPAVVHGVPPGDG